MPEFTRKTVGGLTSSISRRSVRNGRCPTAARQSHGSEGQAGEGSQGPDRIPAWPVPVKRRYRGMVYTELSR